MPLPTIRKTSTGVKPFFYDYMHLTFSNGVERVYERYPPLASKES